MLKKNNQEKDEVEGKTDRILLSIGVKEEMRDIRITCIYFLAKSSYLFVYRIGTLIIYFTISKYSA